MNFEQEINRLRDAFALFWDLKNRSRKFRLPDDAQQRTTPNRIMEGNRHSYRRPFRPLLHNFVATPLADCNKSMAFENLANLRTRENSEATQPVP